MSSHNQMDSFGRYFRITLLGESHSDLTGVEIEGVPSGISVTHEDFMADIDRRRPGETGTTARREEDLPILVRGIENEVTTGTSIRIHFRNNDIHPSDYAKILDFPRPGHADMVRRDRSDLHTGGGKFSGRMTLPLVAAGTIAKKMIASLTPQAPISISAHITEAGGIRIQEKDPMDNPEFSALLRQIVREGDSLGGIVECRCENVPAGLGAPFFDSFESRLSHLIFSIPGVRGIEFGDGFHASAMKGSEHNDPIIDLQGHTSRNGAGGINGGISNGNPILFRTAFKPTSSIAKKQTSIDLSTGHLTEFSIPGRHDACFVLRTPVIVESAAAILLADLLL